MEPVAIIIFTITVIDVFMRGAEALAW